MVGTMSNLTAGEWIDRPAASQNYRVIGPWPDKPDSWVVAIGESRNLDQPPSFRVLPGDYLVMLRDRMRSRG